MTNSDNNCMPKTLKKYLLPECWMKRGIYFFLTFANEKTSLNTMDLFPGYSN